MATEFDLSDKQDIKIEPPKMRKVILHNDDYTPDTFVVDVLRQVFHQNEEKAFSIMSDAHKTGKAIAGVFPAEIAESKVSAVQQIASDEGHPLEASTEIE